MFNERIQAHDDIDEEFFQPVLDGFLYPNIRHLTSSTP